jgi:hypothetical protein
VKAVVRSFLIIALAAASAALAADPEYVVLVDDAPLYDVGHFGEDDYIIDRLEAGTPVTPRQPKDPREVPSEYWGVTLGDGREGGVESASFGYFVGIYDTPYVVIVDGTPLYEKGHYGADDHVLERLEYGTPVQAGPVYVYGIGANVISLVRLKDGREGVMETGTFGAEVIVVADNAIVYFEPFGFELFELEIRERVGLVEGFSRSTSPDFHAEIITRDGRTGYVKCEAIMCVPEGLAFLDRISRKGKIAPLQGVYR